MSALLTIHENITRKPPKTTQSYYGIRDSGNITAISVLQRLLH
jgi:hypothetical protein